MLAKAEAGDKDYQRQLVEAGKEATAQVEHIVADQRSYAEVIENEAREDALTTSWFSNAGLEQAFIDAIAPIPFVAHRKQDLIG